LYRKSGKGGEGLFQNTKIIEQKLYADKDTFHTNEVQNIT
jgi:hypothetical protein